MMKANAIDRTDPQDSARVFERLHSRSGSLLDTGSFVCESIRVAHQCQASCWSINLFPAKIRLNVGQVEACTIRRNMVRLLLAGSRPSECPGVISGKFDGNPAYAAVPIESGFLDVSLEVLSELPDAVVDAHQEYIRRAAHLKHRSPFRRAYSKGFLLYLEMLLNESVPRPSYAGEPEFDERTALPNEVVPTKVFREGAAKQIFVNAYERSAAARRECIRRHGSRCSVCDMSFRERYGPTVDGFIHVHHLKPISALHDQGQVDPIHDLRPVCPNCHSVIHSTSPPLTIPQVRQMLNLK